MTGKTHLAVGTAAALCVTQPPHLRDWVLCIGAAVVGSVISDVAVSYTHLTLPTTPYV